MQLHAEREVLHLNLGHGTEKHEPFKSMTATGKLHAGIMWQPLPTCKQIMYQCVFCWLLSRVMSAVTLRGELS